MKIGIISTDYRTLEDNKPGGIEVFTSELSRALAKQGVEVYYFYPKYENKLCEIECYEIEHNVILCPICIPMTRFRLPLALMLCLKKVAKNAYQLGLDIIHYHVVTPMIRGIKGIVTFHGSPLYTYIRRSMGLREFFRERIYMFTYVFMPRLFALQNPFCLKADAYVFVLYANYIEAQKYGRLSLDWSRVTVIYNGIDAERLRGLIDVETVEKIEQEQDAQYIMFMGRFTRYKGVMDLVKAFAYVARECRDVNLLLFGSGPIKNEVLHLIDKLSLKGRVKAMGSVPRRKLLAYLSRAYAVVHPSYVEAGTMVVYEAYAFGKPVVANRANWSYELVEKIGAGIREFVFNHRDFADKIVWLLQDNALYRKLSQNALNAIEGELSIKSCAHRHIELYKRVLSDS